MNKPPIYGRLMLFLYEDFQLIYGAVDDDFAPRAGGYEYHIGVACGVHLKAL